MRRLSWSLTILSFARIRFAIVIRLIQNRPLLDFPQMCVKPRKSNVSGLPRPRPARFAAANRPNSISRVLSGCSSRPNFLPSHSSRAPRSAPRESNHSCSPGVGSIGTTSVQVRGLFSIARARDRLTWRRCVGSMRPVKLFNS
jgi:hypothetical protein